jgi:nucleotidyltransferase/DNA polymerase involved in DNA repair
MVSSSVIGHLDTDCFYVSCERVRHPSLRRKPVGVLGNQGACIIARSYELKARGIKTGQPIWEARRLCPQAIYVKRDFRWYEVLSRQILELVRAISPYTEYYSIDEFFFDASFLPVAFQTTMPEAARRLQERVLSETGVPVSIGIARTRTLAKLVSDGSKPYGCQVVLSEEERATILRDRPVDEITGIAGRSREKLAAYRISTCEEFARADRTLIRSLLTKKGEDLWWELNATPIHPLLTSRPYHRAVSRGGSLGGATDERHRLEAWLVRNTERLIEALDTYGFFCERESLFLGFKAGFGTVGKADLLEPTADFEELVPIVRQLFDKGWESGAKVDQMQVMAERLQFRSVHQRSLFGRSESRPGVSALMRQVNARCGRIALRSGATVPLS